MPLLAKAIAWLGAVLGGWLVNKVLVAIGVGVASFTGANLLLDTLKQAVLSRAGGVVGDLAGILGLLQIDVCISMILSAYAIRLGVTAVGGVVNKVTFKNKNVPGAT